MDALGWTMTVSFLSLVETCNSEQVLKKPMICALTVIMLEYLPNYCGILLESRGEASTLGICVL